MTDNELEALTDAELLALHRETDGSDPALEAILGEIERRNLDL